MKSKKSKARTKEKCVKQSSKRNPVEKLLNCSSFFYNYIKNDK